MPTRQIVTRTVLRKKRKSFHDDEKEEATEKAREDETEATSQMQEEDEEETKQSPHENSNLIVSNTNPFHREYLNNSSNESHLNDGIPLEECMQCLDCGHLVPSSNWTLHQATCHRRTHPSHSQNQHVGTAYDMPLEYYHRSENHHQNDVLQENKDSTYRDENHMNIQGTTEKDSHNDHENDNDRKPSAHYDDTTSIGLNSEFQHLITHEIDHEEDDEIVQGMEKENPTDTEVIILNDDDESNDDDDDEESDESYHDDECSNDDESDDDDEIEWHCPRCTLLNSMQSNHCAACGYTMNTLQTSYHPLPTTATATTFLHPNLPQLQYSLNIPPEQNDQGIMRSVAGNALLGGAIGAISGLTQNSSTRGFLGSAIHGALGGAFAGALSHAIQSPLRRTIRTSTRNSRSHRDDPTNENPSVHANTTPRMTTRSSSRRANEEHHPHEYQEEQLEDALRTTAAALGRNYRIQVFQPNSPGFQIVNTSLLGSGPESFTPPGDTRVIRFFRYRVQGDGGTDGEYAAQDALFNRIPYEQLLELFGDGTVNRGINEERLESFPITAITKEDTLPDEHRTCPICLEGYHVGQERRSLPCLHGFHKECIDQWLSTHDTCPICKFDLSS